MDAMKYFKEKSRLCKNNATCTECPLSHNNNGKDLACGYLEADYPEQAVAIIKKWSTEHPPKTRQSEFLKMFPNACILYIDDNKVIDILPCAIDKDFRASNCNNKITCSECKLNYWLAEVE